LTDELFEQAARIAVHAEREMQALVGVSSPSGDVPGAEEAIALCSAFLPDTAVLERVPCSSAGFAPDLVARIVGTGTRRLMLLGHVDTVVSHGQHAQARLERDRIYGAGTVDMKGGVALALGIARALAEQPERFGELAVLMVTDEEWRTASFAHVGRFAGYDACLCFEAGEISDEGHDRVIVARKAASTLRVTATGRAAHSGSAPHEGANALLALARASLALSERADPHGSQKLTVVPTIMHAGDAINVVPAAGEIVFDMRANDLSAFDPVLAAVPASLDGVALEAWLERIWPGMDSRAQTSDVLAAGSARLGRPIVAGARGGASDASHFAASIPLTIDGLGPRGDGAHTPQEFALRDSLRERTEVALALALTILER